MSAEAKNLFDNYKKTFVDIISTITKEKEAAIPKIIVVITTVIVPSMMTDVGRMKKLSGIEKRDIIIEAVDYAIDTIFEELNKNVPALAKASWDETLHAYLDTLLPPMIKLLVSVENNELKFNKKVAGCMTCTK